MKVPLGRTMARDDRRANDRLIAEAIHRVKLAIGEVRVIEHRKEKTVVRQHVANQPAIVRARQAYVAAAKVIGQVRQEEGLTDGPRRLTRIGIEAAMVKLEECRREIERLQGLTV
jgi:hypothetical protein